MVFQYQDYPFTSKSGIKTSLSTRADFQRNFLESINSGHQIFISNIFSDAYLKEWQEQDPNQQQLDLDKCFIISDMSFTPSQFIHVCPSINESAFLILNQTQTHNYIKFIIQYSGYLGIKCLALPFLPNHQTTLLNILNQLEEELYKAKLGVIMTIRLQQNLSWENYIQFRKKIDPKIHLDLLIEFTANLPPKNIVSKWNAQKITFFSFSKDCYVMNNNGNPVLPLAFQQLTKQLFKLKSGYLFSMSQNQAQNQTFKVINFFKYVNYLFQIMAKNSTKRQMAARGLYEVLQHPLQPYADNLQSQTYSVFQFDTPKYDEYAVSILLAFQKINVTNRNIIVYYLGSGRGALIPGIVEASKKTKKKVTIYAIQKNPFPLQSLKRRIKENKWSNIVKIVKTDIKSMKFQEKPDIFFSELLGGFGDNQLSPECLKWAEEQFRIQFSKIEDRKELICIPEKYSSFLKPVSYPSVHRELKKEEREGYFTVNFGWHYSPFKSQKVWEFNHPLPSNDDEAFLKKSVVQFKVPENITVHGFLGSFDCNLYDSSYFSIVPESQTIDMYSWFPIYFAFVEQEYLQNGQVIQIWISRVNKDKKVWYEWGYRVLDSERVLGKESIVHNKNGWNKCIYL